MAAYGFSREPKNVDKIETQYRHIKGQIPASGTKELIERLEKVESRSMHGQLPIVWDKAIDFQIYDIAGNKFIDFTSTIFVTNTGHANEHVIGRVKKVLDDGLVHTYAYSNKIRAEYLEKLISMCPDYFGKAFLMSAGTESTEAALKLMRLHGMKKGKKKLGIITLEGNWHGRTMGAQSLCSNPKQKEWIGFSDPNIHHIPFPYEWSLKEQDPATFLKKSLESLEARGVNLKEDICGVMLETFQGWGAVFYPQEYVQALAKVCHDYGILLAFDEMQAGFARTGKMFGFEHYGVKPDLIAVGKGMGGGFPISGVIGKAEILDLPDVGDMSSTHSANPVVCAAALGVLEEIESKKLIQKSKELGEFFHERLNQIKGKYPNLISRIYGHGLLAAVHFQKENGDAETLKPSLISEKCMQKGLLVVHTGRESIKLAPPLSITREALDEGLSVFEEAVKEVFNAQ